MTRSDKGGGSKGIFWFHEGDKVEVMDCGIWYEAKVKWILYDSDVKVYYSSQYTKPKVVDLCVSLQLLLDYLIRTSVWFAVSRVEQS